MERLRRKRLSADPQLESATEEVTPSNMMAFLQAKKRREELESAATKQIEILNMFERFEEIQPDALNIFMEQAKKRGLYQSIKGEPKRKGLSSSLMSSVEYSSQSPTRLLDSKMASTTRRGSMLNSKYGKFIVQNLDHKQTSSQRYSYYMKKLNEEERQEQANIQLNKRLQNLPPPRQLLQPNLIKTDSVDSKSKSSKMQEDFFQGGIQFDRRQGQNDSILQLVSEQQSQRKGIKQVDEGSNFEYTPSHIYEKRNRSQTKVAKDSSRAITMRKKTNLLGSEKLPTLGIDKPINSLGGKHLFSSSNPFNDKPKRTTMEVQNLQPVLNVLHAEDNNVISKRVLMIQKLPKLHALLDRNDKFNDFFKRLCTSNNTTTNPVSTNPSLSKSTKQEHSKTSPIQQSNQLQSSGGQYLLKNLRLSKQNIKVHISKRYGKSFSDKILQILESYNKTMHNIEVNSYIDLINYCFFGITSQNIQGQIIQVPNIYKLLFSIIDIGNKGFICEHDVFQVIWSLSNDKTQTQQQQVQNQFQPTEMLDNLKGKLVQQLQQHFIQTDNDPISLSINYKDQLPQVKKSVYIECFQNDFNLIVREFDKIYHYQMMMQSQARDNANLLSVNGSLLGGGNIKDGNQFLLNQKVKGSFKNPRKHLTSLTDQDDSEVISNSTSARQQIKKIKINNPPQRLSSMGATPRAKRHRNQSQYKKIFEAIHQHAKTSLDTVESVPKTQQNSQVQNQSISPHISAFSHFNPVSQALKEKKEHSKTLHGLGTEEPCKQLAFDAFSRLPFENEIPQFIEDFFMHMTTVSYRELIKKQTTSTISSLPVVQRSAKKRLSSTNITLLIDPDDNNLLKRNIQYFKILALIDKSTLKQLVQGFKQLAQNATTEKNKLNLFLTQQSIVENFKRVFGVFNESLALRLYNILSEGVNMKRIYLPQYIVTIMPLFTGNLAEKMYFVFRLLDGDNDGQLQSKDISDILNNVLVCPTTQNDIKVCECPLFKEIHTLYKKYVDTNLLTYKVKKLVLDFTYFMSEIKYSCLINEFIDKLTMTQRRASVFSHEQRDIEVLIRLHDYECKEYEKEFNQLRVKGLAVNCAIALQKIQAQQQTIMEVSSGPSQNDNDGIQNDEDDSLMPHNTKALVGISKILEDDYNQDL